MGLCLKTGACKSICTRLRHAILVVGIRGISLVGGMLRLAHGQGEWRSILETCHDDVMQL
jgi:hypothetical protein